ncbi:DUF1080 domain-containing protein [uncultured Maribacter sp.]|uniref:3-keto-disaccharide hydrolase n=1 Tax=uncultured Maribacter sp. TaxID=431308 RepID=UPI00261A2B35|nr:DUF1080 domain-containing protein [uncultured Maribacter sp.]
MSFNKNLKNASSFLQAIMVLFCYLISGFTTAQEDGKEWKNLFNGKDLSGWTTKIQHYETGDNFGDTFRVADSIIQVRYDKYEGDFNDRFGHLYYNTPYSYFHLEMDYRFVDGWYVSAPAYTNLNSGIMFHSQDPKTMLKDQNWPISVELQLLAEIEKGIKRPTGNMCSPGTDVIFNGVKSAEHCLRSTSKTYPKGQWVRAELIVLGDSIVKHIINGELVLTYTKPKVGGGPIEGHNPKIKKDGQSLTQGFIALQSEGQAIDFKNIKIKNLKGCMNPKAKNYRKYYIKSDEASCEF